MASLFFITREIGIFKQWPLMLLVTICCHSTRSFAQQDYSIKYNGIKHGLSSNTIESIFQDYCGFMWFGTDDGLKCYNGFNFKVFHYFIVDNFSVNDNLVKIIAEDDNKRLWPGIFRGINMFLPSRARFQSVLIEWSCQDSLATITDWKPVFDISDT